MKSFLVIVVLLCAGCQALAQHTIEVRGADSKYRFVDWTFPVWRSFMADFFYVGVPGSNEFNLGAGYGFKPAPSLLVAPLVYAVIGKEGGQCGVKFAALIVFEKAEWKANVFVGHFAPVSGNVSRYQVLDTGDVTRVLFRCWEAGFSTGFFHAGTDWNPQVGPLVKRNDRLGAWGLSYRFGPQRELRVTRVLILKK